MLLRDAPLTFREYVTEEKLPLATVFRAVLDMLAQRKDAVLFGAQAVNAYTDTARMTEDIDVLSTDAAGLAEALRSELATRFRVAIRVREVASGQGFRVYQLRKPKNRHLVDVRQVERLPAWTVQHGIRIVEPVELIAMKVESFAARKTKPKGDTDHADLRRLLLAMPELRDRRGAVAARLRAMGVGQAVLAAWSKLVRERGERDDDE